MYRYRVQTVYIGVKVYEPNTLGLAAEARGRDNGYTWRDDCVELYFDSDHNIRPFVQIIVNSVGAVEDRLYRGRDGGAIAPGAVWGFNICPVRVTNLSQFSQWAPTYGDSQRPDRLGYLVFGD